MRGLRLITICNVLLFFFLGGGGGGLSFEQAQMYLGPISGWVGLAHSSLMS